MFSIVIHSFYTVSLLVPFFEISYLKNFDWSWFVNQRSLVLLCGSHFGLKWSVIQVCLIHHFQSDSQSCNKHDSAQKFPSERHFFLHVKQDFWSKLWLLLLHILNLVFFPYSIGCCLWKVCYLPPRRSWVKLIWLTTIFSQWCSLFDSGW